MTIRKLAVLWMAAGIALAVETIPDAFATLGNVTGDLTATTVVARRSSRPAA